jgi:3-hydroxymyristoyl/3-hydroxydecanoyl-(acyl carrier protein) dehydratase
MPGTSVELWQSPAGFPADSRCLDGHFPGRPIVPGAVTLAFLAARLAETGRAIARVERMKFQRTLGPGVPFDVRLTHADGQSRADWRDAQGVFASARLVLRRDDG